MTQLKTAPTLYVFNCLQGNCQCFARNSVPPFSTIAPHLTCIYEVIIENGKRNMIFIAEKFILYYFSSFLRGVAQSSLFIVTSLFIIQNKSFLYCAFSFCWQKKTFETKPKREKTEPTDNVFLRVFCCLLSTAFCLCLSVVFFLFGSKLQWCAFCSATLRLVGIDLYQVDIGFICISHWDVNWSSLVNISSPVDSFCCRTKNTFCSVPLTEPAEMNYGPKA